MFAAYVSASTLMKRRSRYLGTDACRKLDPMKPAPPVTRTFMLVPKGGRRDEVPDVPFFQPRKGHACRDHGYAGWRPERTHCVSVRRASGASRLIRPLGWGSSI